MKKIIKDYFTFSKKERTAIVLLLLLIACFIVMPYLYAPKHKPPLVNKALTDFLAKTKTDTAEKENAENASRNFSKARDKTGIKKENFYFDPNTISETDWKRLGINERTARTILNYRNKGGKFKMPEDIRKIWGIKKEDADRLLPYVKLAEATVIKKEKIIDEVPKFQPVVKKQAAAMDINTATETEWKTLPGVGDMLSARIVKYRDRIGGFINLEQVKRTYGLADSVYEKIEQYLIINQKTLPKLNLNTATFYDLKRRLSIPSPVAKSIISYREENGSFKTVADLQKIAFVTDTMFARISLLVKTD